MEGKSDYQVLMVQGSPELAKRLAMAYPGFDVVVATSQFADPLEQRAADAQRRQDDAGQRRPARQVRRRRRLLPGRRRARCGSTWSALNSRYDGPGTPMKKVIEDEYRSMLKAAGIVENFPRHDYASGTAGATFVGAETCKQCHPEHVHEVVHAPSTPRPSTSLGTTPSRTRSTTPSASPATRPASSTPRAGAPRPRRPTSRATSARTATGRPRSTSPSPTTPRSASRSSSPPSRPTRTDSASAATTRTTRRSSTSPPTGASRPQGARRLQGSEGPPGDHTEGCS